MPGSVCIFMDCACKTPCSSAVNGAGAPGRKRKKVKKKSGNQNPEDSK